MFEGIIWALGASDRPKPGHWLLIVAGSLVAIPVMLLVALPFGLVYVAAFYGCRRLDKAITRRMVEPEDVPDLDAMLHYEVCIHRTSTGESWVPWSRMPDETNIEYVRRQAANTPEWDYWRIKGIKVRNATGSGKRSARHDVGSTGADVRRHFRRMLKLRQAANKQGWRFWFFPESSEAACRIGNKRASNAIVEAVDELIRKYEGNTRKGIDCA